MRYRTVGFFLVCLSPIMSFLVLWIPEVSLVMRTEYLTPIIWHTLFNLLVIGFQVSGLTLYYIGHKKKELKSKPFPFFNGLSGVFIVLGIITILFAYSFYYGELIPWSMEFGVRELTIWDHAEYATWAVSGLFWSISGVIFLKF